MREIQSWTGDPIDGGRNFYLNSLTHEGVETFGIRKMPGESAEWAYLHRIGPGTTCWHFTDLTEPNEPQCRFATIDLALEAFASRMQLPIETIRSGFNQPPLLDNLGGSDIKHWTGSRVQNITAYTLRYVSDSLNSGYVIHRLIEPSPEYVLQQDDSPPKWQEAHSPPHVDIDGKFQTPENVMTMFAVLTGLSLADVRAGFGIPSDTNTDTTQPSPPTSPEPFKPFNIPVNCPELGVLMHMLLYNTRHDGHDSQTVGELFETHYPGGRRKYNLDRGEGKFNINSISATISTEMERQGYHVHDKSSLEQKLGFNAAPEKIGCNLVTYHPGYLLGKSDNNEKGDVRITTEQLDLMAEACVGGYWLAAGEFQVTHAQTVAMADETRRLTQLEQQGAA